MKDQTLVKGASLGEGLGNQFLSHIREVDAICEVVRCFNDDNIVHVEGGIDPIRDIEIINVELMLADLEVVQNRLNRIGKKAAMTRDKSIAKEVELLNILKDCLGQNQPIRTLDLTEEEEKIIKNFNLLTKKPIIYMANVAEEDLLENTNPYAEVIVVSAKIESELADLEDSEKEEFMNDLGIKESGLNQLIKATYKLLGLKTFFTAGKDEVKAWTFKNGMKAPACAGIIHTDFEKGFIKAEVMSYDDLKNLGNEIKVKENGKLRLEGKDYIMQDGDICVFRFNV